MSKRVADKYLTDRNWDQEDEEEDVSGEGFQKADDEVLRARVIRKAKRRIVGSQPTSGSAFSGFTGLKAPSAHKNEFTGFSLPDGNAKNLSTTGQFKGFGKVSLESPTPLQFNLQPSAGRIAAPSVDLFPTENKSGGSGAVRAVEAKLSDDDEGSQSSKEYNRHLAALNKSVSEWIKSHVEKNPLCDLTPIFSDYKKHLAEIDEKFGQSDNETSQNSAPNSQESPPKSSQSSSNGSEESKFSLTGFSRTQNGNKEELKSQTEPVSTKPLFAGFPSSSLPKGNASPFKGFATGKAAPVLPGFSFGSSMVAGNKGSTPGQGNADGEEEYVPPKPESNIIVEEDAFFSIRCKLFYKKGDTFADKGVGQLYLKPSNGKTQLLVRADTSLGQILLNILLQPSMPMIRQGKNNVMITCIPNPAINEKEKDRVVPMLIRVKTSDDADRLFKTLEEKKQEVAEEAADS